MGYCRKEKKIKVNTKRTYIAIFTFVFVIPLMGQKSELSIKGQVDGFTGLGFSDPLRLQSGIRFIPVLSAGKSLKKGLKFDGEFSFNSYLDYSVAGSTDKFYSSVKPYRMWLRLSSERFEIRAGLQKINFGSATMLRPLMWFDKIDPRDPLQLTDGVYSLLTRYYFKNKVNIWAWVLLGNDKPKGWELVPSKKNIPEFGGRFEILVPKGESAISYHHRKADLSKLQISLPASSSTSYNEDRLALDGKWDIGPGVWTEISVTHSSLDTAIFPAYTKMITLGIDYTFAIGNGINIATEFFRYNTDDKLFGAGRVKSFSLLSANYPFGINNRAGGIIYYNWTDNDWYRIINFQHQTDNWTFYLFAFWNPDKMAIYNTGNGNNMFAGKGIQLMVVYNF